MELVEDNITDYLAIVISIITFVVSYIFTWRTTDKFGLRSKIYEKKLEVCLQLIELIKAYEFYYEVQTSRNEVVAGGLYITKEMKHVNITYNMFKDTPLFIDNYVYDKIYKELNDIKNSPYLDKSIVESLKFFDTPTYLYFKSQSLDDFVKVTIGHMNSPQMLKLESCETLAKFIYNLKNILVVSEKWVNKTSSIKYRLNI